MAYRCKQCTPPRAFGSISKLRSHQWKAHRELFEKPRKVQLPVPPAPSPDTAPTPVAKPARPTRVSVQAPSPNGAFGTLQAALQRYEEARQALTAALNDTQERMRNGQPLPVTPGAATDQPKRKKRHISPEGRARIVAATRQRWAAKKAANA